MPIVNDSDRPLHRLPGLDHRTVAGASQGVRSFEVWKQALAPGAASPVHRHACDEVIVVLSGSGECMVEGQTRAFAAGDTIIVPPDVVHQIVNTGSEAMHLVAALGAAPVRVCDEAGRHMPLPWDEPAISRRD